MTSGSRSDPEKSSGERSDPRDTRSDPEKLGREDSETDRKEASETRSASGASREERTDDPRDGENSDSEGSASETNGKPDDDDIPLNIAGHESRNREGVAENDRDDGEDGESLITDLSGEGAPAAMEMETDDDEVEPVELLVNLADDGDIDPWDIDIVAVTDKFLDRLDGADLRTGGRALFYASVLLRMKSDHLLEEPDEFEEPAEGMDGFEEFDGPAVDPFDELEREMDRRLERKRARGMPQTLDELVRELRERERESFWKAHRTYDTSDSPHGYSRGTQTLDYRGADDFRMDDEPTVADVTGTAHDEDMETTINEVYTGLREQYEKGRTEVLFAEIRESGGSTVETFLGLLFLAHRGQVRLQQDELFGDLWVQDPGAVADGQEALADGGRADERGGDGS
ncbi:segregation/condensation protein A [Salinirubellus sp. GCM10025818]|uniref:segregation/condensation protein A n=1 Tax=Salinirubellus TaxID=2162630 RepID=UPI0030D4FC39